MVVDLTLVAGRNHPGNNQHRHIRRSPTNDTSNLEEKHVKYVDPLDVEDAVHFAPGKNGHCPHGKADSNPRE